MTRAKDISKILTDADISGTLDVTGAITGTSATLTGDITASSLNSGQLGGRRNLIFNGAMQISQRAISASAQSGATPYPCLDRFRHTQTTTAGRYTVTQESITDLEGFGKALKIACTTADTSIASTERFIIEQRIEGFNLQGLEKGFSTAKPVTVSFYVKGHDSATYVVALYDIDNDRFIGQTFNVTTSWARQTVTFAGDTTGKLGNDNTNNLSLRFYIHAGSNYTSGTLQTSWGASSNAVTAGGINSIFESTSATFFLTGVQLEVGSQATAFEHRSFGEELALCQRYFIKDETDYKAFTDSNTDGGSKAVNFTFPTVMRTLPTMTASADAGSVVFSHRRNSGVAVTIGGAVNARSYINGGYTADSEL